MTLYFDCLRLKRNFYAHFDNVPPFPSHSKVGQSPAHPPAVSIYTLHYMQEMKDEEEWEEGKSCITCKRLQPFKIQFLDRGAGVAV